MLELVLLTLLSIVTGRLLNRRYKVASIAHCVLYIVLLFFYLFTIDIPWIKDAMMNWIGKLYYDALRDSLSSTVKVLNGGLSALLVIEFTFFILIPLFSIIALIKEVKEQFKELRVRVNVKLFIDFIVKLVLDPSKDFKHTENETYLILGKLLN